MMDYLFLPYLSRKAIHVGNKTYSDVNEEVYGYLKNDIPKSVKPWLETLLNNDYKVMIYRYIQSLLIAKTSDLKHFLFTVAK